MIDSYEERQRRRHERRTGHQTRVTERKRNKGPTPVTRLPHALGGPRAHKLANALVFLEAAGIKGQWAYPLAFQALSRMGIVLKPYQYWNPVALFLFQFIGLGGFLYLWALFMYHWFPRVPRAVSTFVNAELAVQIGVLMAIGFLASLMIVIPAAKAGLPRWRDL